MRDGALPAVPGVTAARAQKGPRPLRRAPALPTSWRGGVRNGKARGCSRKFKSRNGGRTCPREKRNQALGGRLSRSVGGYRSRVYRHNRGPVLPSRSPELRSIGAPCLPTQRRSLPFHLPGLRGALAGAAWRGPLPHHVELESEGPRRCHFTWALWAGRHRTHHAMEIDKLLRRSPAAVNSLK